MVGTKLSQVRGTRKGDKDIGGSGPQTTGVSPAHLAKPCAPSWDTEESDSLPTLGVHK